MGDSWANMAAIGQGLHKLKYDVLLFDLRGHGVSDPARLSMGRRERRDIQAVLAEISARGALALSGSNQWIVVRRDEEKLRTYPGAFSSAFDP